MMQHCGIFAHGIIKLNGVYGLVTKYDVRFEQWNTASDQLWDDRTPADVANVIAKVWWDLGFLLQV
jgi:hypothetical protein